MADDASRFQMCRQRPPHQVGDEDVAVFHGCASSLFRSPPRKRGAIFRKEPGPRFRGDERSLFARLIGAASCRFENKVACSASVYAEASPTTWTDGRSAFTADHSSLVRFFAPREFPASIDRRVLFEVRGVRHPDPLKRLNPGRAQAKIFQIFPSLGNCVPQSHRYPCQAQRPRQRQPG
jgi:hypothetical protein